MKIKESNNMKKIINMVNSSTTTYDDGSIIAVERFTKNNLDSLEEAYEAACDRASTIGGRIVYMTLVGRSTNGKASLDCDIEKEIKGPDAEKEKPEASNDTPGL